MAAGLMAIPGRHDLLQRAFHLFYHHLAWSYDAVSAAVSFGHWQAWGRMSLLCLPGPRVLDLGHGPGHLLVALAVRDFQPIGLDLSPQMGRIAQRQLRRRGLPTKLVRGRGQTLPFAAGSFDGVVSTFPAPYIVEPGTITAIKRVLRPGGRLVIVPEAELTGTGPATRVIEWLYRITGQRQVTTGDNQQSAHFWVKALGGVGFTVTIHHLPLANSLVTIVVAVSHDED